MRATRKPDETLTRLNLEGSKLSPYLDHLTKEFGAEEGSFLLQLRIDLHWDPQAFRTLTEAMLLCCKDLAGTDTRPRWLAEGFWYLSYYVREWSTHPDFPRTFASSYYESAYQRLHDLAFFFFLGESPYTSESGFGPIDGGA